MNKVFLQGKKTICNFVGRSWKTVEEWILNQGFPACKINGVWESDSELIDNWRKQQIINKKTENEIITVTKPPRRLIRN